MQPPIFVMHPDTVARNRMLSDMLRGRRDAAGERVPSGALEQEPMTAGTGEQRRQNRREVDQTSVG